MRHWQRLVLALIAFVYLTQAVIGIRWGLPGRYLDPFLFGGEPPWPGEKIIALIGDEGKFSPSVGNMNVDPLAPGNSAKEIDLTATEAGVAAILLRYRLYTYQPDEMITMMALAGMRPGQFKFDPRLYQYGGLFIYPVGALIKLCAIVGLIDLRTDLSFYLDHPDEFAKFYIVARAYAAAWGLVGVFVVFGIARRLGSVNAGLLAAVLFATMPVVVCMAHEGKPHLPGAVLMLLAVWFAMRQLKLASIVEPPSPLCPPNEDLLKRPVPKGWKASGVPAVQMDPTTGRVVKVGPCLCYCYPERPWWLLCLSCGAAVGMVLSSTPIILLIPLVAFIEKRMWWPPLHHLGAPSETRAEHIGPSFAVGLRRTVTGLFIAGLVYVAANPYVVINAFTNREVLRSNFGNSSGMYEIAHAGEGFLRVMELTIEGAGLPVMVLGVVALAVALVGMVRRFGIAETIVPAGNPHPGPLPERERGDAAALIVPAAIFFLQFVLLAAGKPAEYGRFGIFPNTALAIGAACAICSLRRPVAGRRANPLSPLGGEGRVRGLALFQGLLTAVVILWTALCGAGYLWNFHLDAADRGTRRQLAEQIARAVESPSKEGRFVEIHLLREPAPYACPPIPFSKAKVLLHRESAGGSAHVARVISPGGKYLAELADPNRDAIFLEPVDDAVSTAEPAKGWSERFRKWFRSTPISWANKPFYVEARLQRNGESVPWEAREDK